MGLQLNRFSLSRLCFSAWDVRMHIYEQFLNSSLNIPVDRERLIILIIVDRRAIFHFLSSVVVGIGSRSQDVVNY